MGGSPFYRSLGVPEVDAGRIIATAHANRQPPAADLGSLLSQADPPRIQRRGCIPMLNKLIVLPVLGLLVLVSPACAADEVHLHVAWWSTIPFALLLLSIALLPLKIPHWWESNLHKGLVSALVALPVIGYLLYLEKVEGQDG